MKMSGHLFKEIMYDTLYLKTSFLIFREKLEWLVKSEKKDSWYGRDLVSFKALIIRMNSAATFIFKKCDLLFNHCFPFWKE